MLMQECNSGMACSTLIIGCFGEGWSYKTFCDHLQNHMKNTSIGFYKMSSYSFVFASTSHTQLNTKKYLEDFGFWVTPEAIPNKKNQTKVQLHIMSVPDVLKKLEELYPKKKTPEVKPKKSIDTHAYNIVRGN